MSNQDKFLYIVSPVAGGLVVSLTGIIFGKTAASIGLIVVIALWALSYMFLIHIPKVQERKNAIWIIDTVKKIRKIEISAIDVHKSPNWKNDNQLFLCIHNASFFRDIRNLSVVIAFISKIESGKSEFALNRSVILREKINIRKMMGSTDVPLLEVLIKENKFVIRAIHQETVNRDVFEHEFDCGKYIIQIVIKRNDVKRDSVAIPIYVNYDGSDKISGYVGKEFPKAMFPMSL